MRVFFSYVSDQIIDIELLHGNVPRQPMVQAVMDKVIDHLDKARKLFWDAVRNVCLDNKYIVVEKSVAHEARRETPGAVLVKAARYIPVSKSIECEIGGATPLTAKCP